MKNQFPNSIFLLCITMLLSSCWMLGPRTVHAPLFEEKGEVHIGGYINPFEGFELQGDYAVSDHMFVMGDISGHSRGVPNSTTRRTARVLTGGMGYYTTMGKHGRFSTYAGITYGSIGNVPSSTSSSRNPFLLPYMGANVGYAARNFESIFTLRYSGNYFFIRQNSGPENWNAIEPVVTLRLGGRKVKWHTQLGFSYPTVNTGELVFLSSFGLTYRLKTAGGE